MDINKYKLALSDSKVRVSRTFRNNSKIYVNKFA